jgi:hypothetical protein
VLALDPAALTIEPALEKAVGLAGPQVGARVDRSVEEAELILAPQAGVGAGVLDRTRI